MDTKIVYGMLIGDGALVGVSSNTSARWRSYWWLEDDCEDWCIVSFTLPENVDVEDIVDTGDMYTDADNMLAACTDWVVMDCGERPFMSPFFVSVDGCWCFANFDGSVGMEYWTPGEDVEDDCDDDDSFDEAEDY